MNFKLLSWQQPQGCHSVSLVMYIFGAKFQGHGSNLSRDFLKCVLYCFTGTTYDVITFLICILQNANISNTKEDIANRKTPFFFILKRLSNKQQFFFTLSAQSRLGKPIQTECLHLQIMHQEQINNNTHLVGNYVQVFIDQHYLLHVRGREYFPHTKAPLSTLNV